MRLQLDSTIGGAGGIGGSAATGAPGASTKGSTREASDSPDSSYISGTSSLLNRVSGDHAARIQQLTDLVQKGSYQVSGAAISASLVSYALQQGDAPRQSSALPQKQ